MMLFDETAFEGCESRDDLDTKVTIEKKRRRWDPIAEGFVCLAKVSVGPIETPKNGSGWGNSWRQVVYNVVGKRGERAVGRTMYERMTVTGDTRNLKAAILDMKSQVKAGLLCHSATMPESETLDPMLLDGMIVPVEMTVYERYKDKKMVNGARIVCAHPRSGSYGKYLELVERLGPETMLLDGGEIVDRIPGWRLYPDAPAARIMEKMMDRAESVEDPDDFELEIASTNEAARRAQLVRMIPKARTALWNAEEKIQAKRDRANGAHSTASKDTTPEKAASRAVKADKAAQVLQKAEARLIVLRERLAALLDEWDAMQSGTWKPAARKSKEVETIVMTHAEIMAQIAKPLAQHERDRRAAVAAAFAVSVAEDAAREAAMPVEEREARDRAIALRKAQARLDATPSQPIYSIYELQAIKRRKEAKALDAEILRARRAKIKPDPEAEAAWRERQGQDASDRNAGRTTSTIVRMPVDSNADMVDGVRADQLPRDHPEWCPF